MLTRAKFLMGSSSMLVAWAALAAPAARAQSTQQVVIDGARKTLADLRRDPAFGNALPLLRQARAVLIVPRLLKGGFIVGGEVGQGVLLARTRSGWSAPVFCEIGTASFGLQVGLEESEVVLLVMTQRALEGLLQDEFKIGGQAGIAVATLGSGVEGAIGGASAPDLVVWSSSTGVYGGLTIDGSIIRARPGLNAAFYGRPVAPRDVLFGRVTSPHTIALQRELDALG